MCVREQPGFVISCKGVFIWRQLLKRIILFSNTSWYLYNHRLTLAEAARREGMDVILVSPPDTYADRLIDAGFEWYGVCLSRRGMKPVSELYSVLQIRSLYERLQPDLVHHFTIKPVIYGSLAARLSCKPGVINSITGQGYLFVNDAFRARIIRTMIRPLYAAAFNQQRTIIVFQNQSDQADYVDRRFVSRDQVRLIPGSGVDLDRFQVIPEPDGKPVVMLASRLLWDKGIAEFVEASRIMKAEGVDVDVVLVGRPDPGNPASITNQDMENWVREGLVNAWGQRDDMPRVLGACNVFVLPSYGEGLPKVVLEASAVGRPVVVTDVPGCRDVVVHGETGLIVPVKDSSALANAIRNLLDNPILRLEMGQAGRRRVQEHYSADRINDQYLNIYRSLIDRG